MSTNLRGTRRWRVSAHPVSWWTLLVTSLAILMTSVDAAILPAVLPFVQEHFGLDAAQAGLVNSLFFLGTVAGAFFFGWLSDVVGAGYRRTWVWIAAMALSVVGGVFTFTMASSWVAFQVLRVVMGVSRGGSESTNVALVGDWWQKENRGFAVGTHHTGFPLGQFVGPAVIASIIAFADWQLAFLLIPLIGVPIMVAQAFLGTRKNQEKVQEWIVARGMTPPATTTRGEGRPKARAAWTTLRSAIRNHNVRMATFLNFAFLWCELGLSTFLVLFLTDVADIGIGEAVLISGASGLTGWFGQILWGSVSDAIGRKKVLYVLLAGWVVSILPLWLISESWHAWVVLLIWGLFRNAPYPVVYALVIDSAPREAGASMGLIIGLTTGVGGAISAAVTGWLLHSYGWGAAFAALVAGLLVGVLPLWAMRETVGAERTEPVP